MKKELAICENCGVFCPDLEQCENCESLLCPACLIECCQMLPWQEASE